MIIIACVLYFKFISISLHLSQIKYTWNLLHLVTMAAANDSDSYDTGTGSDEDSEEEDIRKSVNVWDLPSDSNALPRAQILKSVHRQSQSMGFINQKKNHFQHNNYQQNNINLNRNKIMTPPPQNQQQFNYNNNNNNNNNSFNNNYGRRRHQPQQQKQQPQYQPLAPPSNMYNNQQNMYNQMNQVQMQSYSVQNLHSAPQRQPQQIQQSQTMPPLNPQNQMAFVKQQSNSHQHLYQNRNNNNNNNRFNNNNNNRLNNNFNNNNNNNFRNNANHNRFNSSNNNNFNLRQMQHQFASTPNLHQKQNDFVPPSPQSMQEQQKYNNWRSKRKLIDDEKENKAEEMKVMDEKRVKEAEEKKQQWLRSQNKDANMENIQFKNKRKNVRRTKSTGSILKRQNDYLQQPLRVGYMHKEGKFVKSWKKRWFVLRVNGKMDYFKKQNAKKAISTIDCSKATRILHQSWGKDKQWGLILFTPNRNWKFTCPTNDDRNGWFKAIENIITVRK